LYGWWIGCCAQAADMDFLEEFPAIIVMLEWGTLGSFTAAIFGFFLVTFCFTFWLLFQK
jgi:hypothetical protein